MEAVFPDYRSIAHCPDVVSISDGGPLLRFAEDSGTVVTVVADVDKLGKCY